MKNLFYESGRSCHVNVPSVEVGGKDCSRIEGDRSFIHPTSILLNTCTRTSIVHAVPYQVATYPVASKKDATNNVCNGSIQDYANHSDLKEEGGEFSHLRVT